MKKFFFTLFTLCLAVSAMAQGLSFNLYSNKTAEVTYLVYNSRDNYSGLTSVTIPETISRNGTTYSVTSIGDYAFFRCSSLTSITIPNSVTNIGYKTFSDCTSLASITIGNSVTSIGYGAFQYCKSLTSIVVEANNAKYDSRDNCNAIIETATNTLVLGCKNTIIPNSVTSIGEGAFYQCSYLTSITIPNSVTSIGSDAFYYCNRLTSIAIPNSVTKIGVSAFANASAIASFSLSLIILGHSFPIPALVPYVTFSMAMLAPLHSMMRGNASSCIF